ncbi:MAG: hypothetical protein HY682_12505 [Chloroflexi bacterium]|nr:hypothetical protein [Chloroflexota bacterium]
MATRLRSFWSNFERMQGVFDLTYWFALFVVVMSIFSIIARGLSVTGASGDATYDSSIPGGSSPLLVIVSAVGVSGAVTIILLTGRERLLSAVIALWMLMESGSRGAAAA